MKESQDEVNSAEMPMKECTTTGTRDTEKEMIAVSIYSTLSEASADKLLNCSTQCAEEKSRSLINGAHERSEEEEEEEMQQINSRKYLQQLKSKREESIKQIGRSLYQMSREFHEAHFTNNV